VLYDRSWKPSMAELLIELMLDVANQLERNAPGLGQNNQGRHISAYPVPHGFPNVVDGEDQSSREVL